ncbi:MAG: DnaJ domain-containing protein [Putridiphycobacter sp.]
MGAFFVFLVVIIYVVLLWFSETGKTIFGREINVHSWFVLSRKTVSKELLLLTAYVINLDGKPSQKELNFVYWFIETNFGKNELKRCQKELSFYLTKRVIIKRSVEKIDFEEDKQSKILILNYLIKTVTIDGLLTDKELEGLKKITKGIGLSYGLLNSLLGTHAFITEEQRNQQTKQKKNQKVGSSKPSRLKLAYSALGLSPGSSVSEIKKAYRKLVNLYHPDKTVGSSGAFKKEAKEQFLKINEAYDLLKEKLAFK